MPAKIRLDKLLVERGLAILMISSELPEVLGMSDRILVMRGGRIVAEYSREEANQELIATAMMSDTNHQRAMQETTVSEMNTA